MQYVWRYLKKYAIYIFLCFLGSMGMVIVNLSLPTILGLMIDNAIIPGDTNKLYYYGGIMGVTIFIGLLGRILSAFSSAKATTNMTQDMRNDAYAQMMSYSHREYKELGVASLTTRITTDAFVLLQFVEQLLRLGLTTPLMLISSLVMMLSISPNLAVVMVPTLPLLVIFVVFMAKATSPLSSKQQDNLDRMNGIFRENINGIRVIRSFTQEEEREGRFSDVNDTYRDTSTKIFKIINLGNPLFGMLVIGVIIVLVWLGAKEIEAGNIEIGILTAFIEYSFHALFSLMMLSQIFIMYPRASVSAKRLNEVMQTHTSIDANKDGVKETEIKGEVIFENVDFKYPDADEPVLKNISFKATKGQTVAFIGSTGSGKSTIIQLIPRLYDVTGGRILIDGVDVRDYSIEALRNKIGYAPQKALLFTGTIAENLRYGKSNAQMTDFQHASNISQASEFISRLESQYDTVLAEGGTNLSGGQKQRLSIARAIIYKPDIYIFDDSFSALDFKTDAKVRNLLKDETVDALTFIVAQRISSIMDSDLIIVLNEGEIVDQGTHHELLDRCTLYQEIAETQLSEEELNR